MSIVNKIDGTDYLELVESIDGRNVSFDAWLAGARDYRSLCVRHDVDRDLENAVKMAEYEAESGIVATYFLLHTADYFRPERRFMAACETIAQAGHSIGIHIDPMDAILKGLPGDAALDSVWIGLNILREYCGVRVTASACHGYPKCYEQGFLNYQIWTEFDPLRNEGVINDELHVPQVSLAEWGLACEVYFLDYAAYLSEGGMDKEGIQWAGVLLEPGQYKPFERGLKRSGLNVGKKVISRFNDLETGGMFHLMTHTAREKWEIA